ncbi:MAG: PPC domain-containing protein [Verrucomicrobiia bacterium]|jgi:hypothetical protein
MRTGSAHPAQIFRSSATQRFRCLAFTLVIVLASLLSAESAAPKLDAFEPAGGQAGTTNQILSVGKIGAWPVEIWCDETGIKFTAAKKKNYFDVAIEKAVKPGPYLVRIHSKDGASPTTIFVVSNQPETLEKEPNGTISEATPIEKLPVVINGRLSKTGDTDFFRLKLKKGQTIVASLDGYSLGSLIDPFIHLYDPEGYDIALASDTHNIDPFLLHTVDRDGTYALQVFAIDHKASVDVSFSGNGNAVYRMTVTTAGNRRIGKPFTAKVKEAGEKKDGIQKLKVPASVSGTVLKKGERDRYSFPAKKGEQFLVRVESHTLHYPLDPVLVINRPDGRLLREVDDTKPNRDAEYLVKASQDGDHVVEISDLFRRGNPDFRYRLSIAKPVPSLEATIDKDVFELKAGKTVDLKLKLTLKNSHATALKAMFSKLPEGVTVESAEIKAKSKTATVKLKAAKNVATASVPFRMELLETADRKRKFHVTRTFITGDSRGDYLLNGTPWLWLTVTAEKVAEKKQSKK